MIHLGLIGYPLGHSLSPKIHTAALKACKLDGDYSLFPIHPDDEQGLKDILSRVRTGEITGLNVTIPHKQNVIELMDELAPTAQATRAVNTVYLRNGKLSGDNTDASGFLSDLKRFIGNEGLEIKSGKSALVLGAGGSARAVVYALVNDGWQVSMTARRIEQARQLKASLANYAVSITGNILNTDLSKITLVVNTTPLGMTPNSDQSPWPEGMSFPRAAIYDLVYNPRETKLVKDSRAQGLKATTGLGMLIEQAALAFEVWTGCIPPRDTLFESVN